MRTETGVTFLLAAAIALLGLSHWMRLVNEYLSELAGLMEHAARIDGALLDMFGLPIILSGVYFMARFGAAVVMVSGLATTAGVTGRVGSVVLTSACRAIDEQRAATKPAATRPS